MIYQSRVFLIDLPFAPPGKIRPKRNITARWYSRKKSFICLKQKIDKIIHYTFHNLNACTYTKWNC